MIFNFNIRWFSRSTPIIHFRSVRVCVRARLSARVCCVCVCVELHRGNNYSSPLLVLCANTSLEKRGVVVCVLNTGMKSVKKEQQNFSAEIWLTVTSILSNVYPRKRE